MARWRLEAQQKVAGKQMGSQVEQLILILGQPRSGSSMTAGIFAAHDVWTGQTRPGTQYNEKGFFENMAIKKLIHKRVGELSVMAELATHDDQLAEDIQHIRNRDGYKGGPWLWKGSPMYWQLFMSMYPKMVVCHRSDEQIFKSCRASPAIFGKNMTDNELHWSIAVQREIMDMAVKECGAPRVFTEKVVTGDFRSIKSALIYCGLDYDEKIVEEFVDGSLLKAR